MKKNLWRIGVSAAFFLAGIFVPADPHWLSLLLELTAYAVIGWDVVWKALRNIVRGQVFDENFLMALASIGAFFVGEYSEAVAVMLFYQVGELFQHYAVEKSRRSIGELMDIRPDTAALLQGDEAVAVDPFEVHPGDRILVRPGERVPLDGVVEKGTSLLDTSALTGESVPRTVEEGQEILSGCVNQTGVLTVRVTKEFGESTVSRILDLVENASEKKSKREAFITRFAAVYTPIVVIAAVLLAVVPPLLVPGQVFGDWLYRALTFLVVSCPCALVISVPLSFFGGIGGASRMGVLVKGGNYLEALSHAQIAVFDKTGTLTRGVFAVQQITAVNGQENRLLALAASAESRSTHPIAQSLQAYAAGRSLAPAPDTVEEIAGRGVCAVIGGKTVRVGSRAMMEENGLLPEHAPEDPSGTVVHVAEDGQYLGWIQIRDQTKDGAKDAMAALKRTGVEKTVMLTGDNERTAREVAGELGLDAAYAQLLPDGKVRQVEALLQEKRGNGTLLFVGDGMNDAPVLARADVGIAMGALGSDAAIEAADVVLMNDDLSRLPRAIRLARRTLRIANQNIVFALAVKVAVLVLSALGLANMWFAVFADVGVAVLAICNALRALRAPT